MFLRQLQFNRARLVRDIASYAETDLEAYLERSGNDLKSIYRSTRDSRTGYLRQAGLLEGLSPLETVLRGKIEELSGAEKKLLGRMAALIQVDGPERAAVYSMLVALDAPRYAEPGMREQAFARMLFYTLWDDGGRFRTYDDGLDHLRGYQFVHPTGDPRQWAVGIHSTILYALGIVASMLMITLYTTEVLLTPSYIAEIPSLSERDSSSVLTVRICPNCPLLSGQ